MCASRKAAPAPFEPPLHAGCALLPQVNTLQAIRTRSEPRRQNVEGGGGQKGVRSGTLHEVAEVW